MASSGSGQGTPITISTPVQGVYDQFEELSPYANCAVPLSRYAKLIGYDECAFWGVIYEGQERANCSDLWSEFQRLEMAQALAEAQQDIERVAGYPLCPTWIVGDIGDEPNGDDRWVDVQPYRGRQLARYAHVIEPGVRATEVVSSGEPVDHTGDPATVGPVPTAATSAREIKVYYPGSNRQITPSQVTVSGGQVTIQIPRCRLVKQDLLNSRGGVQYATLENFLETVDIVREYTDPSTNAVLVAPGCRNESCHGGCGECTHAACIYVRDHQIGALDVRPAAWAGGTWEPRRPCRGHELVRLYYKAGVQHLSVKAEMAIVRLAHAKAPEAPCSCPLTEHLWRRDRHVPDVLTRERLNCPFGLSDGAWVAYQYAKSLRVYRMGIMQG